MEVHAQAQLDAAAEGIGVCIPNLTPLLDLP